MANLRRFLFSVGHLYSDPLDLRRAQGILAFTWIGLLVSLMGMTLGIFGLIQEPGNALANTTILIFLIVPIGLGAIFLLIKRKQLRAASVLFVLLQIIGVGVVVAGGFYDANALLLIIPLTAAASLLGRSWLLLTFGLLMVFVIIGNVFIQSQLSIGDVISPAARWQLDLMLTTLSLTLATFFLYAFNGLTQRLMQEAQREVKVLRQIVSFTTSGKADNEEAVYAEAINFIRTQLSYPFAQIFYIGSDGNLSRRLRVALGVKNVTEQHTDVTIPDGSIIDEAYRTKTIVTSSLNDAAIRRTHFAPSSLHGAALPVIYDGSLLGVMDVQLDTSTPFDQNDLNTLNALSEQIAAAATQIRLIQALRENVRQQEELVVTLRSRLQELRRTSGVESTASWQAYVEQRGQAVFGFDLAGTSGNFISAQDLPPSLRPVIESGARQIITQGDVKIVNIPINLRGEILGAMSFSLPKERVLTERQLETAELVANRLALALENKRLFEQTQAQALRERRANEATNLLITATNVESVMNVAAASFNEALGAIATHIHLQPSAMIEIKTPKDNSKDTKDTKEAVAS